MTFCFQPQTRPLIPFSTNINTVVNVGGYCAPIPPPVKFKKRADKLAKRTKAKQDLLSYNQINAWTSNAGWEQIIKCRHPGSLQHFQPCSSTRLNRC